MDKEFSENSHIVAVGTTGNVFSWEAIEELNIKRKNWKDLISEEPFKRKDLITLRDPQKPQELKWTDYFHVKKSKEELETAKKEKTNTKTEIKNDKKKTSYDGGFTCAGFDAVPEKEKSEAELPGKKVKDKGYVQLLTNFGPINLELRCDLAPKTCENFILLCKQNYYDNTIFHRNIPNFMVGFWLFFFSFLSDFVLFFF